MKLTIYQVDAFTDKIFKGNPAAICPLERWLDDALLQNIALENNLSETAYFVGGQGNYDLRWFTPGTEVDLCGHATLAAAWVIRNELDDQATPIRFQTRSGELRVENTGEFYTLDFPLQSPEPCEIPENINDCLGVEAEQVLAAEDYLVCLKTEKMVRELTPDFTILKTLPLRGVMVTAPGDDVDFVSRWFGPKVGVDEDPVTGSAHTTLAPFWAEKLGKNNLQAKQISARSGELTCRVADNRVYITGKAVKYMEGTLFV